MKILRAAVGGTLFVASTAFAQTSDLAPLSAIDWLSESVEQPRAVAAPPVAGTQATRTPDPSEAPVANSAQAPSVTVQPLGAPAPRALGLLAPSVSGFSIDLWAGSDGEVLDALLMAQETETLPALQDLIVTLAISRANPPFEDSENNAFFRARIDKLLSMGAVEQAQAMLGGGTADTPALFRRYFDVSLLTGTESVACASLRDKPDVAPTPAARIFCLARSGDWSAAALTLNTGVALGDIDQTTGDLLARFLDPELYEGEPDIAPPARMTPLSFRMFEAIGSAQSTANLPLAFAHADLRDNVGWKAQLEAAERLTRAGALPKDVLVSLYTERRPAASGGVWERAKAVIALQTALQDDRDVTPHILRLTQEAKPVGLLVPLAQVYGPQLLDARIDLSNRTVFEFLLLSDEAEAASQIEPLAATDLFLAGVAQGDLADAPAVRARYPMVRDAFSAAPDAALLNMAANGRQGEAILRSLAIFQQGLSGDSQAFGEGFATLRAIGLEDVARRAALQYLLLQ